MTALSTLAALGQSVWIDSLSRATTRDGTLWRQVRDDGVVGLTSNPAIFEQALAGTDAYDPQIRELHDAGIEQPEAVFRELARRDVQDACDLLRPVWERTGGRDGWVSLEVDPRLAGDARATADEARGLRAELNRPNAMVKIPATVPGLDAIAEATAAGVPVNVTLIFSLERYAAVLDASQRGLERRAAAGRELGSLASVASFFVSRIDSEADRRLDALGARADLRGRLAIANAKLAYRHWKDACASPRWAALAARGARPQRLLWASTATKDPAYADTRYVDELAGPETVTTLPPQTLAAFRDHGDPAPRLEQGVEDARALLGELARAGVDYADVTATLERQGVDAFTAAFERLLAGLRDKLAPAPA